MLSGATPHMLFSAVAEAIEGSPPLALLALNEAGKPRGGTPTAPTDVLPGLLGDGSPPSRGQRKA